VYPQGYAYPSSSVSYPPNSYYPYPYNYGYGYGYPWGYYYPVYVRPRRARGETLALVVSWIVTFAGGLSILCGLLLSLIVLLAISQGLMDNLTEQTVFTGVTLGPIVGGGFAIYFGIRGIMRRPSPRFSLPNPWLFAALTALVLAAGVILWYTSPAPGPAVAVLPLVLASGILPALAILSFTSWRLRMPTTRRHAWMSFFYGLTLAPLLAIIFELVASILFALLLSALGHNVPSALANPTSANPNDPVTVVLLLLSLSVAAPVIEEGVKPLGAVLLMRRLRTPASAFLMGMAAGIGFDMLETIGYIGQGEADWVGVAIGRIGAGLLHGVGAGMAALGWYYLINGKGVRLRWLRGFGGIAYAMAQHAIFNGSNLLSFLPGPVGTWMQQPAYLGRLPLDGGILLFFAYYIAIFGVLIYVTGRLVRAPDGSTAELTTGGPGMVGEGERGPREPTPVGSGAR
jgi:RsiW-degrading membrane proteinase PrsW (M82 family)